MEIIIFLILIFVFMGSKSGTASSDGKPNNSRGKSGHSSFRPADTFYLEDGLDHEVDDDGYCYECDDYHDV